MSGRKIFKELLTLEEAGSRLLEHYKPRPRGFEEVPLHEAHGRVLAEDVFSTIDVPGFDRATMDGYALRANDTFGAEEDKPVRLRVTAHVEAGDRPTVKAAFGEAVEIATGAPMPEGADAVVMVEYTQQTDGEVKVWRSVVPGENVMPAGTDIAAGERVLLQGQRITSREMGVIAALGLRAVKVYLKPVVAIISTGKELAEPGEKLSYGRIYDVNANSIAGAVHECGGISKFLGIVPDNEEAMKEKIEQALEKSDVVLTSGSTSAGVGDLLHTVINTLGKPGILVHGLSVKPGKPTIVAVVDGKPVFGLPGYPTSALIIFSLLVQPIIRGIAGLPEAEKASSLGAEVASRIFSAKGRSELLPVHVVRGEPEGYFVYPTSGGSGAITSLAMADGFVEIPSGREFLDEGELVQVKLFSKDFRVADLVFIGSHCIGVDLLLRDVRVRFPEFSCKIVNVGSTGGLHAVGRGEADVAGIHILDESTGEYNKPSLKRYGLSGKAVLVHGYDREQGFIVAKGNPKSIGEFKDLLRKDVVFINRNRGSGTRILVDMHLKRVAEKLEVGFEEIPPKISGYMIEAKSHSAVAAAISHGRADVGVGLKAAAKIYGLEFIPIAKEKYDFVIPRGRIEKEAIKRFVEVLKSKEFSDNLAKNAAGLTTTSRTGLVEYI